MIALLVALAIGALISIQPWAPNAVAPQLALAPGIGVAVDDALALDSDDGLAVAPARPAVGGGGARLAVAVPSSPEAVGGPRVGLGAARVVARPASGGAPQDAVEQPEPAAPPPPAPAPPPQTPVAVPVSSPAPAPVAVEEPPAGGGKGSGGERPGPTTAGVEPGGIEEPIEVGEGEEGAFALSFFILPTAYLAPGVENSIARFSGEGSEEPTFGLQLWDDGSEEGRGLWASGDAMAGERFLAPVEVGVWHELAVYFRASSDDDGFYLVLLDGEPVDARAWIGLIDADAERTWIELGPSVEAGSVGGVAVGAIFERSFIP